MIPALKTTIDSYLFSPLTLVQPLFSGKFVDMDSFEGNQLSASILRLGAFFAGMGLPQLAPKIDARFSHLIPAALTGVVSGIIKIAFDFLADRPSSFNFCRVPTKDLTALVHWGLVSSLALKSELPAKPIKVSQEEALKLLEKNYDLGKALRLFEQEPIKISKEEVSKIFVEGGISFNDVNEFFEIVQSVSSKVGEASHQEGGQEITRSFTNQVGLSGSPFSVNPKELRGKLKTWLSQVDLDGSQIPANSPKKDSNPVMSLQEAVLCWIGQPNFFDQMDAFSKGAWDKANTVAYFAALAITAETLKQSHPILLNTVRCLSLATISAIAMPIISAVDQRLFSFYAFQPCLEEVLFCANTAAALVSHYVVPKLFAHSSHLRLAAIQIVSFFALSTLATYLTFSKSAERILEKIETFKETEEENKKPEKVLTAIKAFQATNTKFQKVRKVENLIDSLRGKQIALETALKELAALRQNPME